MNWILLIPAVMVAAGIRPRREEDSLLPCLSSLCAIAALLMLGGQYVSVLGWPETGADIFRTVYEATAPYLPAVLLFTHGYMLRYRLPEITRDDSVARKAEPLLSVYIRYLLCLALVLVLHLCLQDTLTMRMVIPALVGWPGVLMDEYRVFFMLIVSEAVLLFARQWTDAARRSGFITPARQTDAIAGALLIISTVMGGALGATGSGTFWSGTALALPFGLVMARAEKTIAAQLKASAPAAAMLVLLLAYGLVRLLPSDTGIARCAVLFLGLTLITVLGCLFHWDQPLLRILGRHAFTVQLPAQLFARVLERETYFDKVSACSLPVLVFGAILLSVPVDGLTDLLLRRILPSEEDA